LGCEHHRREKDDIIVEKLVEPAWELASHVEVPALDDVVNLSVCHEMTVAARRQA